MEGEEVIALFDFCWFNQEIFKKSSSSPTSSSLKKSPDHQIGEDSPKAEFSSQLLSIHPRSNSDYMMSSKTSTNSGLFSPDSVLYVLSASQLEIVLSGTEGEAEFPGTPESRKVKTDDNEKKKKKRKKRRKSNDKLKKGLSKSLSELEFEELKGFMDLGFVFSEEDKNDSSLVEIIPGLQRLGREKDVGEQRRNSAPDESSVTRPYLSEAWEVLDRRNRENPLMNWKVPAVSNETGMKNSLKWWAHVVASTVR
ncbi:uncharacterized protein LOC113763013 [Coffea eugenioides]|uniref:uncharacterized protein LOC113763013 n=1 Tax=Coffea eugenioides TaxID=49369 RepID=UPI000F6066FD|nr:uncharacterized protein LOC113763013 [Coffea eugenioides]